MPVVEAREINKLLIAVSKRPSMSPQTFDRETWLDLTVNIIPLGILAFFFVAFLAVQPWGSDSVLSAIQFSLIAVPLVLLAVVTYYTGRAIFNAEQEAEAEAE
jgi:hypothetical protein